MKTKSHKTLILAQHVLFYYYFFTVCTAPLERSQAEKNTGVKQYAKLPFSENT